MLSSDVSCLVAIVHLNSTYKLGTLVCVGTSTESDVMLHNVIILAGN